MKALVAVKRVVLSFKSLVTAFFPLPEHLDHRFDGFQPTAQCGSRSTRQSTGCTLLRISGQKSK
jgi:hypothetical protein